MLNSKNTLILSGILCVAVVCAKTAQAEGFKFGGGNGNGGGNKGSFKINHSGNNSSRNNSSGKNGNAKYDIAKNIFKNNGPDKKEFHKNDFKFKFGGNNDIYSKLLNGGNFKKHPGDCHDDDCHDHHCHHVRIRCYVPVHVVYSQCYHPQFCCCYVYPGDTWYTLSQRAYGVGFMGKNIAWYNGLPMNSLLVPGQMLRLPVVNPNGTLSASNAPMPAPYAPQGSFAPVQATYVTPNVGPATATTGATGTTPANEEPAVPRITTGSTLMLDGESLGTEKGTVHLRMSATFALPVEVIEWTANVVKITLPKMDLTGPAKASLEVVRADGTLASNSGIELTPAATGLAAATK